MYEEHELNIKKKWKINLINSTLNRNINFILFFFSFQLFVCITVCSITTDQLVIDFVLCLMQKLELDECNFLCTSFLAVPMLHKTNIVVCKWRYLMNVYFRKSREKITLVAHLIVISIEEKLILHFMPF